MRSKKEVILQPYNTGPFAMWPLWLKVVLSKFWVAGAAFYFVGFGMPQLGQGVVDKIFTLGLILGPLNAIIIYPFIKYLCRSEDKAEEFMFIKNNSALRIILHVLYNWLVIIIIAYSYQLINFVINAMMHYEKGVIKFGVEPIFFGGFYLLFDYLLIKMRRKFHQKG